MPSTDPHRNTRILGWAFMAASMLLLLATIFTGLAEKSGVYIPIAMLFLIVAIMLFARAKSGGDTTKRDAP